MAGLPFTLYAIAMLLAVPTAFWFDLQFTLARLGGVPHGLPAAAGAISPAGPGAAPALLTLVVAVPLLVLALSLSRQVKTEIPSAIEPFLVNPAGAEGAAAYVNTHLEQGNLVLASPAVAWLIGGNVADFQMAAAAAGRNTPHLPAKLPRERLAFVPRWATARFVVVDPLWHNWATFHVPGVVEWLAELETWPVRFTKAGVTVYERP